MSQNSSIPSKIDQDKPQEIDFTKTAVTKEKAPEKIEEIKAKKLYEYSIYETLVNTKDAYYSVFDDLAKNGVDFPHLNIFFKNNRLFYLGIGLLIVAVVLMIINSLTYKKSNNTPHFILKIEK